MTGKWPDTRAGAELRELNLEFLDLVRGSPPGRPAYGLDPAISQRLRGLGGEELGRVAATPCLLAGFPGLVLPPAGVAEAWPAAPVPAVAPEPGHFALALLHWLWQTARQDPLVAAVSVGPDAALLDELGRVGFSGIRRAGPVAAARLAARFCHHPRLWPDLIRAARCADPEVVQATYLSMLQLSLVRPRLPAPSVRSSRPAPRTGRQRPSD